MTVLDEGFLKVLDLNHGPLPFTPRSSFVAQRLRRVEARRPPGGVDRRKKTDQKRSQDDDSDIAVVDLRGELAQIIDVAREDLEAEELLHETGEGLQIQGD